MKRSIITFAIALALAAPAAYAQEHGSEGTPSGEHAEGPAQNHEEHGLTEGFHAPEAPFNMANPSPAPVVTAHGEIKGPPPFIGPLINFAILVVLGYMAVKRQVNPALNARRAAVETEIAEAKRLHDEAQALHREYSDRLENLKGEVAALKADFVKQGEAERDRIIAEAQARGEKMRAEGVMVIEQEMRSLREELRREAVLAAVSAAEETVRKNVTPADQTRLVDEFVQAIERETQSNRGASA
ncbi:MAG: ATP synthase F0 subunit B [Polyangiales bacterium]